MNLPNEKKNLTQENNELKIGAADAIENTTNISAPDNVINGVSISEPVDKVKEGGNVDSPAHTVEEIKEEVIKVLKLCYDPEIPVDVWELGLIYDIQIATNGDVLVVMTLTSPSCPVAGILPGEIEQKVKDHPMVHDCKVQLTFDPPWSQKMMSEVAKLELGFL